MMGLISKNRPSHELADVLSMLEDNPEDAGQFEAAFAQARGAAFGITFPYCRVAMQAIYETLAGPEPEVVIPAYTCTVVAHAPARAGKTPRFVDIDPVTYNSPPEKFLERMTDDVSAVVPTHMYGTPVDMAPFEQVSRNLLVVEDGSLGLHPAWRPNNQNITAVTVYSFGSNKMLSTIRGGIVVTHEKEVADKLRKWRDEHLKRVDGGERVRLMIQMMALEILFSEGLYGLMDQMRSAPIISRYLDTRSMDEAEFPPDREYFFSGGQARVAERQMAREPEFIARRQELARRYTEALKDVAGVTPMTLIPASHYSHYALRVPGRDEKQFPRKMRSLGVEVGKTFDYLVADLPLYKKYVDRDLPESRRAVIEVINLPNYPALTDGQFERVVEAVKMTAAK